jgi:hypothetical protein
MGRLAAILLVVSATVPLQIVARVFLVTSVRFSLYLEPCDSK